MLTATLIKDIEFIGINNELILLPQDTLVIVDPTEGIAAYGEHCFDVFHFEYQVLN